MQSLLVVDEAEVGRLTDESGGATRVHAGLSLLRDQQPQRAERRPGGRRRHVGRPHQSRGVGKGQEERTPARPPARSGSGGTAVSGQVGGDEGRLGGTEVLGGGGETLSQQCLSAVKYPEWIWRIFFLMEAVSKQAS